MGFLSYNYYILLRGALENFRELAGADHGWREGCANLFGHENYDPDCGAESLKCGLCRLEPT
jgi:hypothetical protein